MFICKFIIKELICNDFVKEYVFDLNDKEIVVICLFFYLMLMFVVYIFFGKFKF